VADLQRRLAALGFSGDDEAGVYGSSTTDAVQRFQRHRGLRDDGVCGEQTWGLVVEAGYRLGDRRLYQRKPMMRGDDVADLQRRLGALGFDAGKIDGLYGPDTASAPPALPSMASSGPTSCGPSNGSAPVVTARWRSSGSWPRSDGRPARWSAVGS
jgi:peptidoglycan hydrolase-like protein with peptidoglycan-binding domain